ncbi:Phospholipid-transporting ATPase [Entamoeba marina]
MFLFFCVTLSCAELGWVQSTTGSTKTIYKGTSNEDSINWSWSQSNKINKFTMSDDTSTTMLILNNLNDTSSSINEDQIVFSGVLSNLTTVHHKNMFTDRILYFKPNNNKQPISILLGCLHDQEGCATSFNTWNLIFSNLSTYIIYAIDGNQMVGVIFEEMTDNVFSYPYLYIDGFEQQDIVFVLTVSAVKEIIEDFRRYLADSVSNNKKYTKISPFTGERTEISSQKIKSGFLIELHSNDRIPADCIPIDSSNDDGIVYVETAELDGETSLKEVFVPPELLDVDYLALRGVLQAEYPTFNFHQYKATIKTPSHQSEKSVPLSSKNLLLAGAVIRNTDLALCIVAHCGKQTKLSLNQSPVKTKSAHTDTRMNQFVFGIFCMKLLGVFALTLGSWFFIERTALSSWYLYDDERNTSTEVVSTFFRYFGLLSYMIPISCAVSLELTKFIQTMLMEGDVDFNIFNVGFDGNIEAHKMAAKTSVLNDELGLVEYVLTDKTGTLTENSMVFKKASINGVVYNGNQLSDLYHRYFEITNEKSFNQIVDIIDNGKDIEESTIIALRDIEEEIQNENEGITIDMNNLNKSTQSLISIGDEIDMNLNLHGSGNIQMDNNDSSSEFNSKSVDSNDSKSIPSLPKKMDMNENFVLDKSAAQRLEHYLIALAICNEATPKRKGITIRYESQSPDEEALCTQAYSGGFVFYKRTQQFMEISILGELRKYEILANFSFDSDLKTPQQKIILYTKGADNIIAERTKKSNLLTVTQQHIDGFGVVGLRTLLVGMKEIDEKVYEEWDVIWKKANSIIEERESAIANAIDLLENDFDILGATAIEDRLQDGVPETIELLLRGGIKVWMITGDKVETAINIGLSCNLITSQTKTFKLRGDSLEVTKENIDVIIRDMTTFKENNEEKNVAIVFEGGALIHCMEALLDEFKNVVKIADAVICARVTPLQKAEIAKAVKKATGKVCLTVGDGANDVPMINEGHVGVGLFGKEGAQAARASDYALRKFRHLGKLIMFHGRHSMLRNVTLIKMCFYKNAAFFLIQLWYGFMNGFSGQTLYDDYMMTFYNIFITSLPPVVIACTDRDLSYQVIKDNPEVHREMLRGHRMSLTSFMGWLFHGVWQSLIILVSVFIYFTYCDVFDRTGRSGGWGLVSSYVSYSAFFNDYYNNDNPS